MAVSERSSPRTKIWLVVVGIVVLAGAAYVAKIYPPPEQSLAGSVTPADRYRADTKPTDLTAVPLGDQSVSQFMQTDLYQKIVTDKVLAAAFASEAFRDVFSSQAFRDALGNQGFRDALGNQGFRDALGNQGFRDALGNQGFRDALGNQALRDSMKNDAKRGVAQ